MSNYITIYIKNIVQYNIYYRYNSYNTNLLKQKDPNYTIYISLYFIIRNKLCILKNI